MAQRAAHSKHQPRHALKQPAAQPPRRKGLSPLPLVAIFAVILVGAILFFALPKTSAQPPLTGSSSSSSSDLPLPVQNDTQAPYFASIQGNPELIYAAAESIPGEDALQAFSLGQGEAIVLSDLQRSEMEQALEDFEVTVSFVAINLNTGQGICRNAHEPIFGASTFKAPYALYLCSELVDEGTIDLTDWAPYAESDYPLIFADEWENPSCIGAYIQNTLVLSDNDTYEALREAYDYYGYWEWLNDLGLGDLFYSERTFYPNYSAAQGFTLWANLYSYLQSGSPTAAWLGLYLQQTQTSFFRDSLEGYADAVWDKAGWGAEVAEGFGSLSDCGIVQVGGNTYLVALLTSMAGYEDTFPLAEDLVAHLVKPALEALS